MNARRSPSTSVSPSTREPLGSGKWGSGKWHGGGAIGRTLLVLVALSALATSCARERRHDILSFFFDGVPPLDAPEEGPPSDEAGALPMTSRERIDALGYRLETPTTYTHKPVADRECSKCHEVSARSQRPAGSWVSGTARLLQPVEQLCVSCHPQELEFRHGPASSGNCTICHHPHASPNPHLLRTPDPATVCGSCHLPDAMAASPAHAGDARTPSCLLCHDPHGGDRHAFLRGPVASDAPQDPMPAFSTPGVPENGRGGDGDR